MILILMLNIYGPIKLEYMKKIILLAILINIKIYSYAQTLFPEYADSLVDSSLSDTGDKDFIDKSWGFKSTPKTTFYGGYTKTPFNECRRDAIYLSEILGVNTRRFLTLPKGSYIIVMFTDNYIIDYPNKNDIYFDLYDCRNEKAEVSISNNGKDFNKLGIISCELRELDLASISYKDTVRYLKIEGLDNNHPHSLGFNLISIKGLPKSSIALNNDINIMDELFSEKVANRKIILNDIVFTVNSSELELKSTLSLDILISRMRKYEDVKIKIIGHTDDVGSDEDNMTLSIERAKSVVNYLVGKRINRNRILFEGKGKSEPLEKGNTEKARQANRRVEFEIIN